MKVIVALAAAVVLGAAVYAYKAARVPLVYGERLNPPRAEVSELIARPKAFKCKTVSIEGVITKQCTSMGCFFFFEAGREALRVDLADVAMHAPKDRNGRGAYVEGQMVPYGDGFQFWASFVEFK